jgi:hypothetical protein
MPSKIKKQQEKLKKENMVHCKNARTNNDKITSFLPVEAVHKLEPQRQDVPLDALVPYR